MIYLSRDYGSSGSQVQVSKCHWLIIDITVHGAYVVIIVLMKMNLLIVWFIRYSMAQSNVHVTFCMNLTSIISFHRIIIMIIIVIIWRVVNGSMIINRCYYYHQQRRWYRLWNCFGWCRWWWRYAVAGRDGKERGQMALNHWYHVHYWIVMMMKRRKRWWRHWCWW